MSGEEGMINTAEIEKGSGAPADDVVVKTGEENAEKAEESAEETDTQTEEEKLKEKQESDDKELEGLSEEEKILKLKERQDAAEAKEFDGLTEEQIADKKAEKQKVIDDHLLSEEQKKTSDIEKAALKKLFDKYGVTTEEELDAKLNPPAELTEEEKAKKKELHIASVDKFAVENGVFKTEDLLALKNMKAAKPEELVFKDFSSTYKEAYKDRVNDDKEPDPVTEDEIREAFNEQYNIGSDNKALVELGQKQLQAVAQSMIGDADQRYKDLEEVYIQDQAVKADVPKFKEFLQTTIAEAIPASIDFGEGIDKVTYTFEKIDKEALEKLFIGNNEEFNIFRSGKATDEQKARIVERVKDRIIAQKIEDIGKVISEVRYDAGTKNGAKGAKAPFVKSDDQQSVVHKEVTAEDDKKVGSHFQNG